MIEKDEWKALMPFFQYLLAAERARSKNEWAQAALNNNYAMMQDIEHNHKVLNEIVAGITAVLPPESPPAVTPPTPTPEAWQSKAPKD